VNEVLRHKLVDKLKKEGSVVSPVVEAAMRAIPRELFATWLPIKEVYANKAQLNPLTLGSDESTISQPSAVARFLEGFDLQAGMKILEIGAGTGYQAALIAHIVGDLGKVITIDIAQALIEKARVNLKNAGINNVHVVWGDGAVGYPKTKPYDRIVATVGIREIPLGWIKQLKPNGKMIVPLHLGGNPENHILVSLQRQGKNLMGYGLDALDMVVLRGSYAEVQEEVKRGSKWDGGYAEQLHIQVLPKNESLEPTTKQKLIHKKHTTVLIEAR
jgi:protein-L-isoaspartate(D-aspartate) O-methyltransferase